MWTLEEKVEIGSYAVKTSVAKTVRDLSHKYPGLTKQSVSDFRKHASEPEKMKKKKQRRPTLLPEEIMTKTINLVKALRLKGASITSQVINSVPRGIIEANDRSILIENGGYLTLNHQWDRNVLYRIARDGKKMTRRKGTTEQIPVSPGLLKEVKLNYQRQIKLLQSWNDIPDDLIINFDQRYLVCRNHPAIMFNIQYSMN